MKELMLKEAKEFLDGVNNGISKTRDKCWQLSAFVVAVDVYMLEAFAEDVTSKDTFILLVITLFFSFAAFYNLYKSLFPSELTMKGAEPDKLKLISDDGEDFFYDSMLLTTQSAIKENSDVLYDLTKSYNYAAFAVVALIVAGGLFLSLPFLFDV